MQQAQEMEERIRERAYRLWQEAGRPEGDGAAHWQEAERQVMLEEGLGEPIEAEPELPREDRPEPQPEAPTDPLRQGS